MDHIGEFIVANFVSDDEVEIGTTKWVERIHTSDLTSYLKRQISFIVVRSRIEEEKLSTALPIVDLSMLSVFIFPTGEPPIFEKYIDDFSISNGVSALEYLMTHIRNRDGYDRVEKLWERKNRFEKRILEYALSNASFLSQAKEKEVKQEKVAELSDVFENNGQLSKILEGYEERKPQIDMARCVAGALKKGKVQFIEADTGTGKSLGYLIPLLFDIRDNNSKAIISTKTKVLQSQLLNKDIPVAKRAVGGLSKLKVRLLKGRSNYLCLLKAMNSMTAGQQIGLEDDTSTQLWLAFLERWISATEDGDIQAVNGRARYYIDVDRLSSLTSSKEDCIGRLCPFKDRCFLFKVRQEARDSDLLVVNHSLLLSEHTMRGDTDEVRILPVADHLVIDEAHRFADIAISTLGYILSYREIENFINSLSIFDERSGRSKGLMSECFLAIFGGNTEELVKESKRFDSILDRISEHLKLLFAGFEAMGTIPWKTEHNDMAEELRLALMECMDVVTRVKEKLGDKIECETNTENDVMLLLKLKDVFEKLDRWIEGLYILINGENDVWVKYVERRKDDVSLNIRKIDITEDIFDIFDSYRSVILTSATLSVNDSFSFVASQLGLNSWDEDEKIRLEFVKLPPVFNYSEQAIFLIPSDTEVYDHKEWGYKRYIVSISRVLANLISNVHRKTLVLFTSYHDMYAVLDEVKREGYNILVQGKDGNAQEVISRFRTPDFDIAFGVKSLWEGIDLPGTALEILVIVKLPFDNPSDPVTNKLNSLKGFNGYMLPKMILDLKQGIGRLIRKCNDRGAVLCLDNRVLKKFYGSVVIGSLPDGMNVKVARWEECLKAIKDFFDV